MYILNRFETNCGKSMIPFHAIWGLCWYIPGSSRYVTFLPKLVGFWVIFGTHFTHKRKIQVYIYIYIIYIYIMAGQPTPPNVPPQEIAGLIFRAYEPWVSLNKAGY